MGAKVTIDIEARIAKVEESLRRLEDRGKKTAESMNKAFDQTRNIIRVVAGAAAIRATVNSFNELIRTADQFDKLSQKLGVSAEGLQKLEFAGKLASIEIDVLRTGIQVLARNLLDFQAGTGESVRVIESFGKEFADSVKSARSVEEVLNLVADRFQTMEDGVGKTAIAMRLFGRSGAELIPLLNAGSAGLKAAGDEAERFGGIIRNETVRAGVEFNDNMARLGEVIEGLKIKALGPLINDLANITTAFLSASTAALTFGEKLELVFSGNVNFGRFVELRQRETEILKELAENPPERGAIASLLFGKGRNFLEDELRQVREELETLDKQLTARSGIRDQRERERLAKLARTELAPSQADPDQARKAQDQIDKALEALQIARAKRQSDEETKLADVRLDLLQRFHDRGLISEQDFADRRLEIQQASTRAAIRAAESEVEVRRRALARATEAIGAAKPTERGAAKAQEIQALGALEQAQARVNELEREFGLLSQRASLDAIDAQQRYTDEVARTSAELLELKGRLGDAAKARADLEFRDARQRAVTEGDAAQVKRIDDLRAARQAQASFNQERQRGEEILRDLAIEEERVNNSRRAGAITEIEQLSRIQEARRRAGQQLASVGATLRDIAGRSGIPELARQAADFEAQIDSLAASSNLLREKFDSIGESSLATFFDDVISGSKSAEEAFKDFTNSIVSEVNKLVSQELSRRLLTSLVGPSGEGGFGGFFEKLLSGSLFGGGGGGAPVFNALSFPGFQHGGSFTVGGAGGIDSQLVAFRATPGERVEVGAGAGGNISVHINVPPGTDQRAAGNIATEVTRTLSRYNRRNG